jgi:hypothetical protein
MENKFRIFHLIKEHQAKKELQQIAHTYLPSLLLIGLLTGLEFELVETKGKKTFVPSDYLANNEQINSKQQNRLMRQEKKMSKKKKKPNETRSWYKQQLNSYKSA